MPVLQAKHQQSRYQNDNHVINWKQALLHPMDAIMQILIGMKSHYFNKWKSDNDPKESMFEYEMM